MRWGHILCLMSPVTNVGKKEVKSFYCKPSFVTPTPNYANCNIMVMLYGEDMEGKQFCTKVGVTNNLEDFLNMDNASCIL